MYLNEVRFSSEMTDTLLFVVDGFRSVTFTQTLKNIDLSISKFRIYLLVLPPKHLTSMGTPKTSPLQPFGVDVSTGTATGTGGC